MITLLLWLAHHIAPAVDTVRVCGHASPLITHRLPWCRMANARVIEPLELRLQKTGHMDENALTVELGALQLDLSKIAARSRVRG